VSSLIDHHGGIVKQGPQFEAVAIDVTVTPRQGITPYVRVGDWLAIGLSVLMLVFAWLFGRSKLN